MLNIAVRAAREAGDIIIRQSNRLHELKITSKARNSYVSEVDRKAEDHIIYTIQKAYPDHGIFAEESGIQEGDEFQWIIDPLDGTTNYLHGFPQYAVSIAMRHKGRLEAGVIYDPFKQEMFTALRGSGAQLNNRRIRVSSINHLEPALIGTGLPYNEATYPHMAAYLGMLQDVMQQTSGVRRAGSAALDLAYVAAGRLDGFWEIALNPWDIAAGILLIREAGGLVANFTGGEDVMRSGNIVAGNPKIFKALLQLIHPHLTDALK
jgi:myo-inositol-1(or 4)-monophosphatase